MPVYMHTLISIFNIFQRQPNTAIAVWLRLGYGRQIKTANDPK